MKDLLIIGQGLAGSVLALKALERGLDIQILADASKLPWTRIAGGVFNPITGRRFVKTWMAEELFAEIRTFYPAMEKKLGASFFHEKPIYRVFAFRQQRMEFLNKVDGEAEEPFIPVVFEAGYLPETILHPFGGLIIPGGGWVDLPVFLDAVHQMVSNEGILVNGSYTDYPEINAGKLRETTFRRIIFCDGARADQNPFFHSLPFVLTKGEVLTVKAPGYSVDGIVSRGKFILPVGMDELKIGATYSWDDMDPVPTEEARKDLATGFEELCRLPYDIVSHQVGIRPTVKDRRPFIGLHPQHQQIGIFNGLGTKGVTLAPYWADHALNFFFGGIPLLPEVDIRRFE